MPTEALVAVLIGAFLHASWNTAIKSGRNTLFDTILVTGGAAGLAALALPFLPAPAPASVPCLALSAVLQVVYCLLLAAAYRTGDMSHAYPLMRGTAPLLVALACGFVLGEPMSFGSWMGMSLICGGVIALTLLRGRNPSFTSTGFALASAAMIAGYTVVDGIGVRLSGASLSYTAWIFLLNGLPLIAWALLRQPQAIVAHARERWPVALGGGLCSLGSYGLALWAMTQAPIATVAALRETSILFGMLLAALVIREKVSPARLAAGALIAFGAATLRLVA